MSDHARNTGPMLATLSRTDAKGGSPATLLLSAPNCARAGRLHDIRRYAPQTSKIFRGYSLPFSGCSSCRDRSDYESLRLCQSCVHVSSGIDAPNFRQRGLP
jgi:hypothetical protein